MAPTVFVPKNQGSYKYALTTESLTNEPLKILTPYLCLMRYRTNLLDLQYFQHSISTVDTGNCPLALQIERRLLSAQGWTCSFMSFVECPLGCLVLLVHSSA